MLIKVFRTVIRQSEDSELWRAVERTESGHSSTDAAFFFRLIHSVISQIWKQFVTSHRVAEDLLPPFKGYDKHGRSIYYCCSQAESTSDLHMNL